MKSPALCVAIALSLLVAGCAGPGVDGANSPWASEYENALREASTSQQRAILEDHEITDEEYHQLQDLQQECFDDLGVTASVDRNGGGFTVQGELADSMWREIDACGERTTYPVESLYWEVRANPANEDWATLVTQCLRESGIDTGRLSPEEVNEAVSNETLAGDPEKIETCEMNPNAVLRPESETS